MHKDTFTVSYVTVVNEKPESLIRDNYDPTHPVEYRSLSDASRTNNCNTNYSCHSLPKPRGELFYAHQM